MGSYMKVVADAESATNLRSLTLLEACVLLSTFGQLTKTWSFVKGGLWKGDTSQWNVRGAEKKAY